MSTTSGTHVYGEYTGAHHVEAAILNTLWKWMPSYCYEVSREMEFPPDFLNPVRSWRVATNMERYPEDQLPGVILVNNGVPEPPIKHANETGGDVYFAYWAVEIGIHVVAKGVKEKASPRAMTLARMYALAIRLLMIQQRDDEGVMGMVDPLTEVPGVLNVEDDRTTCLSVCGFRVETPNWAEWGEGPIEPVYPPETDPPTDRPVWPVALSHEGEYDKLPFTAEVQPQED